ncbi:flagellar biosynthesis protein FlgH [Cognatishimia sp.]|uniref:flagellar biosynthesis protein FlgH n=1 Tax=Cognatishimia sp. TaxID=2211648 RepID=UPI003BAA591E
MKKLIIILLGPLLLGPTGYFLGKMMAPDPVEAAAMAEENEAGIVAATPEEILYKMPLGKFTIQVLQPRSVLHILLDLDVYIAGSGNFERLNGLEGRNRLRDATVTVISDMAETTLWLDKGEEEHIDQEQLAEDIVRKLHLKFRSLRTAQINEFNTARSLRQ